MINGKIMDKRISLEQVKNILNCCIEDIQLLKSGEWIPDDESCDCTLEALELIKKYLEQINE